MEKDKQLRKVSLYSLVLITGLIIIIPADWDRLEFLLILLFPIILSYKYFVLERRKLKKALLFLLLFIVASLTTFLIHVWQLIWELSNPNGLFEWKLYLDPILYAIPFNDGMWLRQFSTPLLDGFFVYIYVHGFVYCLLALCVYYLLTGQPKKIILAMLAGHFLQYLLILPFHFWVDGHQVWWIQNLWDGTQFTDPIEGYRTVTEPIIPSLNHVFPSMHTSIATVTILLAWREKSNYIKYFFTILNVGIIISTVYLGIHWVVDVLGGVIFGYLTLKLSEKIMVVVWKEKWNEFTNRLSSFYDPLQLDKVNHQYTKFYWWYKK